MVIGSILFGFLLAAVFATVTRSYWGAPSTAWRASACVFIVGTVFGAVLNAANHRIRTDTAIRPREVRRDGYVSSNNCRACHPNQYTTWHASYHRTMTQAASSDTVLAPFDGQAIEVAGRRYRPSREGRRFWMEWTDPSTDEPLRRQIVMTTGSHHMQVFWYDAEGGKLAHLPIVYLLDQQRWIPRYASFIMPTECSGESVAEAGKWNMTCIECHATQGRPRFLAKPARVESDAVELGISCESCHGPAEEHIKRFQNPLSRYAQRRGGGNDTGIANPAKMDSHRSAETCGQCHSVQIANTLERYKTWNLDGHEFRPGDVLGDSRLVVAPSRRDHPTMKIIEEKNPDFVKNTFWSDGMVRVSGREFNGLERTGCYTKGKMSCLSCHTMHDVGAASDSPRGELNNAIEQWRDDQLRPEASSNQACLQCHESIGDDLAKHTHHSPNSSGSQCYNCHMPHTTYGLLKGIRSHQIDSPRVATTVETGRPNACNLCHLDQSLGWSAAKLAEWYDHEIPSMDEDQQRIAGSVLWLLKGDAGQRALAAWAMSWEPAVEVSGDDWMAPLLAERLTDRYAAVRLIAGRTLRGLPGFEQFPYDSLASPEDRLSARDRARQLWGQTTRKDGDWSTALPFTAEGELRRDLIDRLDAERDDSDITLVE